VNASPHPLQTDVLRLAEDAARLLDRIAAAGTPAPTGTTSLTPGSADASGVVLPGTAAAIRAEAAAAHSGAATLVVVGEKKRGKSSLINALVEHPGLLPVEVDVATGVHILVRYAAEPEAVAHLDGGRTEPIEPVDPDNLAEYAAVDPVSQAPRRADVHHVEVGVPAELLAAGLRLVDTPGVGGLDSGHAKITMATLDDADALIFVVDGSTELTASELHFLKRATARIAEVVFVLAQTDTYRSWPDVLERNRRLLAEHAPRYAAAPWYPVSSRAQEDALAASAAGDTDTAARRQAASGFAPLTAALTERIAARCTELRLANIVHVTRASLVPPAAAQERLLRSLAQDPTLLDDIQRRREALRALLESDARWRNMLHQATRELERRLRTGFRRNVNDLRRLAEEKIVSLPAEELATALPRDLEAAIEAVWMDLDRATRTGMTQLTALLERECGIEDADAVDGLTRPARLAALPPLVRTAHDGGGVLGLVERVVPAWTAGGFAASLVALTFGGVLSPLAAGFGLIALLSRRRSRRDELARNRGDTTRHVQRLIGELDTEVPPEISRTVEELGRRLAERLAERIAAQRMLLETELTDLQRHAVADRETIARERERTVRRIAVLTELLQRAADLDGKLGAEAAAPVRGGIGDHQATGDPHSGAGSGHRTSTGDRT
jgi:Dynamin family